MSWILWTLLGTFFGSLEKIVDKKLVVGVEKTLDGLVAAFYRNLAFYIFVIIFGIAGFFGEVGFFFAIPLVVWAFFQVLGSVIYDYFLKNAEIVRYSSIVFIFPLILILFDNYLFSITYSPVEILGFFLLILGGYVISLDIKAKKQVFSQRQWLLLSVAFAVAGSQYFLFKYYNNTLNVNAVSFYTSTWIFVMLFFILGIFLRKKQGLLLQTAKENNFFGKTLISKLFDSLSGLFILIAISGGTVSKVYSFQSVAPLITFLLVLFLVKVAKVDMKESFDKRITASNWLELRFYRLEVI